MLCPDGFSIAWVARTFKTITPGHRNLREVSIQSRALSDPAYCNIDAGTVLTNELYGHWMDLDRALVQLWELRAVRAKISYFPGIRRERVREFVEGLLPETTERGIVELVNISHSR